MRLLMDSYNIIVGKPSPQAIDDNGFHVALNFTDKIYRPAHEFKRRFVLCEFAWHYLVYKHGHWFGQSRHMAKKKLQRKPRPRDNGRQSSMKLRKKASAMFSTH